MADRDIPSNEELALMLFRSAEEASREVPDWNAPDEECHDGADELPF